MSSIFDLKTSTAELSSANAGTSRMLYEQHPPTRDVTTTNFANGAIHTRFSVAGSKWWVPARSYVRMRCSLTAADGTTQLTTASQVAPNMGLMANLFQSGEFRIADKTVSRVSDYMAQVDALETRLNKSKSWLDSVGASANMLESSFEERLQKVSSDGVEYKKSGPRAITSASVIADGRATGTNTVAWDLTGGAAEGLLTFAVGAMAAVPIFNCVNELEIGDSIIFDAGGLALYNLRVIEIIDALNVSVAGGAAIPDVAATVLTTNSFTIQKHTASSRRVSTFELVWQPPMSIFKIGHALPSGKYELVLNPQTAAVYKKRAIESFGLDKTPGAGNDFDFSVISMYFYAAVVDGNRSDDLTYLIDLEETRCQVDSLTDGATGLQQKNFDVSPSTYALTAAFQDDSAGTNTQYSASKFKVRNANELSLTRFYMNYAGQNKPQPDADPQFVAGTDRTTQRYMETILHSGSFFDSGGSETLEEYHERGSYYYFSWPRDGTDRSTRVNINAQLTNSANTRVLIFDHYKAVARIQISDGRVVDVQLDDA
jgi:hypothetical protein